MATTRNPLMATVAGSRDEAQARRAATLAPLGRARVPCPARRSTHPMAARAVVHAARSTARLVMAPPARRAEHDARQLRPRPTGRTWLRAGRRAPWHPRRLHPG